MNIRLVGMDRRLVLLSDIVASSPSPADSEDRGTYLILPRELYAYTVPNGRRQLLFGLSGKAFLIIRLSDWFDLR